MVLPRPFIRTTLEFEKSDPQIPLQDYRIGISEVSPETLFSKLPGDMDVSGPASGAPCLCLALRCCDSLITGAGHNLVNPALSLFASRPQLALWEPLVHRLGRWWPNTAPGQLWLGTASSISVSTKLPWCQLAILVEINWGGLPATENGPH